MLGNFVLENANNPGTGTVQLAGPPAGRRSFLQAFPAGSTVYYAIDGGTQQETGYGVVAAGPPATLTRNPVGGPLVNFTGAVRVYSALPAERALFAGPDGGNVPLAGRVLAGLGAAQSDDHAPRADQIGWTLLQRQAATAGAVGLSFALPGRFQRFRLEFQEFTPAAAAALFMRYSFDGGSTFLSGASDYANATLSNGGSSAASQAYAVLSAPSAGNSPASGHVEFSSVGGAQWHGASFASGAGGLAVSTFGGFVSSGGTATNILIGCVGANLNAGRARLLGGLI